MSKIKGIMMKNEKQYMIGEAVKGCYKDIAHCENGIIWWIFQGKFREHISKASIADFHVYLVREMDDVEADEVYRGRYFDGIATILPPVKIYSKPIGNLPKKILDMVYVKLKPKVLLLSTPSGLHKVFRINKNKIRTHISQGTLNYFHRKKD